MGKAPQPGEHLLLSVDGLVWASQCGEGWAEQSHQVKQDMRERREEEKGSSSAPGKAGYESRGFKQSSPTPCLVGSITHSAPEMRMVRVERAVALPILGSASLSMTARGGDHGGQQTGAAALTDIFLGGQSHQVGSHQQYSSEVPRMEDLITLHFLVAYTLTAVLPPGAAKAGDFDPGNSFPVYRHFSRD